MIKRKLENLCKGLFKQYPVITITGPRQSGKTTLSKMAFPDLAYVNLEEPDTRMMAIDDPRGFLNHFPEGVILDEIQRAPQLPSYIQSYVDRAGRNGMYVLTGSQQFEISNATSQSLAGRTALIKLLPFCMDELKGLVKKPDYCELIFSGFYPKLHNEGLSPYNFFLNYFETYVQRDVRQLSQIENIQIFEKFIRLLAGRIGQLINYNSLANDLGVSQPTIKNWVSILQTGYIIYLLPPFYKNIRKRLVKTPKIYFYDVGMASYLLGLENKDHIYTHHLRGNLFKNLVITELIKNRFNSIKKQDLFFYRDKTGHEVDIVIEKPDGLIPVEIKSSETMNMDFLKSIEKFKSIIGTDCKKGYIIYTGEKEYSNDNSTFLNWQNISIV